MIRIFLKTAFLALCMPGCILPASGISSPGRARPGETRISDKKGRLSMVLDLTYGASLKDIVVLGRNVSPETLPAAFTSFRSEGRLYTSADGQTVTAETSGATVTVKGIRFGEEPRIISEDWIFRADSDFIDWTIIRKYQSGMTLDDTGFPEWSFRDMNTWNGALLGTGGVAWSKFFDHANASLGCHTGPVKFWSEKNNICLSLTPEETEGMHTAVRFSRQPDNRFTLNYSVSDEELRTRHFLSRFIIDRQDIWDSFDGMSVVTAKYRLQASAYDTSFNRGDFKGLNTGSVSNLLNTIARVGVIDEKLMGSNNWHLDMGFVCLHEHWVAQMGIAIDDPAYTLNYRKTLDYFRDNAVAADGNVKDRWACRIFDAKPGTYENGFYECQWGNLLDANTDYVINVADLFQINGDSAWVAGHKSSCEKALEYLLRRDSDNNGLIEVFTGSHLEMRGSDWIDVIWASWENAFINAKYFHALSVWADVEEICGDSIMASRYRAAAIKCKDSFNRPVDRGGFWNPERKWYVYWRDKDGSVHGDNLVTPVNFMAIAFGICDEKIRKEAILKTTECLMTDENLMIWPLSFFPYNPDEGAEVNFPFPNYENGDIFLAWAEAGIRAYCDYDPSIPVKYIGNVLAQYDKDGLAFQRYGRLDMKGKGSDILANNCMPLVGLYRDICGIQPRYDRLWLDPHITSALDGTMIRYNLRDRDYKISLSNENYSVTTGSFNVSSKRKFGIDVKGNALSIFADGEKGPTVRIIKDSDSVLDLTFNMDHGTSAGSITVTLPGGNANIVYEIPAPPGSTISILRDGKKFMNGNPDKSGIFRFRSSSAGGAREKYDFIISA